MRNAKLNLKTDAATSMLLATNYVAVAVAVAIAYGSNKRLSTASCRLLLPPATACCIHLSCTPRHIARLHVAAK